MAYSVIRRVAAGALLAVAGLAAAPQTALALQADAGLRVAAVAPAADGAAQAALWLREGRAEALLAALRDATTHALPPARYDAAGLAQAVAEAATAADRAAVDARLTEAYLRYARDVSSGLLEPRRVAPEIKVRPPRPDRAALLRAAAAAPDMAAHLAALAPADPEYRALKQAYARESALARETGAIARVPRGATMRLGDGGPRVAALRARLAELGHAAPVTDRPDRFDAGLDVALRAFQGANGLNSDGLAGPATVGALNAGPAQRAAQIAVALERLRWNNRPKPPRRVEVNLADARVRLIDDGVVLFDERVVVGRRDRQTPEFSDEMEHMVLNPTWHVPRSIATKDLLPKLQADPTFLRNSNMRLTRPDGGPVPPDPSQHDFNAYTLNDFPYRIKQAPSLDNALGRVKFMFPNADNIYLHDTPDKRLLARDRRAFSSGCVRVRDPLRLAELLLAPQTDDPAGTVSAILATGRERYVLLDAHVPVRLFYRTAWIDDAGALQLREDIYGRDARTVEALRAAGVAL